MILKHTASDVKTLRLTYFPSGAAHVEQSAIDLIMMAALQWLRESLATLAEAVNV